MSISIKNTLKFIDSPKEFLAEFGVHNTFLFIDENVHAHFKEEWDGFTYEIIPAGEDQKRFEIVEKLLAVLLEKGIDRKGTVIGIGGGVVTDLTGFVASIYLRGINFGFLPTTLLAMCDASIGGKNGINFGSYKNMVGNFNQPSFIAFYTPFLNTLPEREFNSGMAEVIKHAIINGGALQMFLEQNSRSEITKNPEKLQELCELAASVKVAVVEQDEYEAGLRKKLNLGHTIGHAIEATSDFTHGECVAIGMVLAAKIAVLRGSAEYDLVEQVIAHCNAYDLHTNTELNPALLLEKIAKDKKRRNTEIDFILPHSFGNVHIAPLSILELEKHLTTLANE